MRTQLIPFAILTLVVPARAAAQETVSRISVHAAAGSHVNGGGHSLAGSVGVSLGDHVELLASAERSHLPTEVTGQNGGVSATRGGTVTFVSGEVRWLPLPFDRISPYVLAGAGGGISRPNVNDTFPNPVENAAAVFFTGGGVRWPVTAHLSLFGDMRLLLLGERGSASALTPIRGGIAWRF